MQTEIPKHQSGKPQNKSNETPKKAKFGSNLTLLDKTLAYYVSQRGANCFWARVLNQCSIVVDPNLGTAGVVLEDNGKRHAFLYDPAYFESLSAPNRRCTLVHEAVHVTCLHIIRFMRLMSKAPNDQVRKAIKAVFNIAADMEANDTYVRLERDFQKTINEGEFWHLPEQHGFPRGLSMENYIELLIKNLPAVVQKLKQMAKDKAEGQPGSSGNDGSGNTPGYGRRQGRNSEPEDDRTDDEKASDTAQSVAEGAAKYEDYVNELLGIHPKLSNDTHQKWMDAIADMAKNDPSKLEQLIEEAQKEAGKAIKAAHDTTVKMRGTVPGGVAQLLQTILVEPTVPWTELLRDWVLGNLGKNFAETTRLPSLSLINVDGIEPFPGQIPEPEVNVTWITDTSGSMSDEAFNKASAEMYHLMQQTKAIRLHHIQVDTVIQNEHIFETGDAEITAQMRYGYGGTTLAAAFARAVDIDIGLWRGDAERVTEVKRPDLMVVFTDGYIEDMAPVMRTYHPGCPTLWLITPGGQVPSAIANIGSPHVAIQVPRN